MAAIPPFKKSPPVKECMAKADPPIETNAVKKMNDQLLLISSNKTTDYFREWTTVSFVLKKLYCLHKNLMFQIDPLSNNCSQRLQYPKRKLRI